MSELAECVICLRATNAGACSSCESRLRQQLKDIVEFQALAPFNLAPGRGGDGRGNERSLGVNIQALDLVGAFDPIAVLESWERDWREAFGLTRYGPASASRPASARGTLIGIVGFLQSWLSKACQEHPAISDFALEVRGLHRSCKAAAGQVERAGWRVTCPTDTDDGECGAVLLVRSEDFGGDVACRACGTRWPVERLLRVVASSRHAELWLDPDAASEWIGVHPATLRRWAAAGRIQRAHGLYEVHSIREALA